MSKNLQPPRRSNGLVGAILTGLILIVLLLAVITCTTKIPAGYVGVVYNMNGGIEGNTLTQGWKIVAPTKKVTLYSIGLEQSYLTSDSKGDSKNDESFSVPTSDGKTVKVNLEFSYRFDEARVAQTFTTFKGKSGEEIKNTFIKPKVIAWTQEITANYPVTDIFGDKRTAINAELDVYLRQKFDAYGIIIDTVNFTDIRVDAETAEAIQKKVNAQQALELARIEAETAQVQAQKDKDVALILAQQQKEVAATEAEKTLIAANAKAEQLLVEAKAQAEAKEIAANAEAQANKVIAESLTPELLDMLKLQAWKGDVPKVIGSSDVMPFVNID